MVISKIVGAVFKIPLTNILGGIGMGYYSTAYSLYTPVFAMTAAAVPTVIIKAVADNIALRRFANAQKVLRTAVLIFGATGLIGTAAILALAASDVYKRQFGYGRTISAERMGNNRNSAVGLSVLYIIGI